MTTFSLEELQTALDRCREQGFTTFVSCYGPKVRVNLSKSTYTGVTGLKELKIDAEGDTVAEAYEAAFSNFPINPLDGISRWKNERLAAPATDVEPGEIVEIRNPE
jgi:hypothetical protein